MKQAREQEKAQSNASERKRCDNAFDRKGRRYESNSGSQKERNLGEFLDFSL